MLWLSTKGILIICFHLRSPIGIFSRIILGLLLKQPTNFPFRTFNVSSDVQKKGNTTACELTKNVWTSYKFEFTQHFF